MTTDEKKLVTQLENCSEEVLNLASSGKHTPAEVNAHTFSKLVGCLLLGVAVMIKVSDKR